MNILALDTSMGACSAAVLAVRRRGAHACLARQEMMARGHAEALMPMVAEVMPESGTAFAELDLIAATTARAASPACASPLPRRAVWRS